MLLNLAQVTLTLAFASASAFVPTTRTNASTRMTRTNTDPTNCRPAAFFPKDVVVAHQNLPLLSIIQMTSSPAGVGPEDGEALQNLFSQKCDLDGLMSKDTLSSIPTIYELLEDGDLLAEEFDDIWNAAPKFPDFEAAGAGSGGDNMGREERIDVDSFIQIYRDIDDIFEEGGEEDDIMMTPAAAADNDNDTNQVDNNLPPELYLDELEEEGESDEQDPEVARDEQELEIAFQSICDDSNLVSFEALRGWSEIQGLMEDNMLGEDELEEMWERTAKSPGSTNLIDVEGFLSFNVALDDLFVFDDEQTDLEMEMDDDDLTPQDMKPPVQIPMFYADDLPPGVIFAELADENLLMGMGELKLWGDLQDMLVERDLLPIELQNIYDQIPKAPGTNDKINEEGFEQLYNTIESLFEEEEDPSILAKKDLVDFIAELGLDEDRLPCGLESSEREIQEILDIAAVLESGSSNLVISNGGDILPSDVVGEWQLLYTTSSTMKFNKGLSGLVPPNGKFGALKQKLTASKYLFDVEYTEKIEAGPASFEVKVTGDWELKNSVSLFTGLRSVALAVEPEKVSYGVTSQKADHWKSLGPLNLLDITYLDSDLRVMRGTTSTDSIFIFKKVQ